MKKLILFTLGIITSLILPYVIEYFMPYRHGFADRNNAVRCDGGMEGPKVRTVYDGKYFKVFDAKWLRK
jgi:hypothetical protein